MSEYQYLEETNLTLTRALGRPRTALDIGCGRGQNTAELKNRGTHVVGLENFKEAAATARTRLDEVFEVDIESNEALAPLTGRSFDLLVFGDVLEHTRDPKAVVERFLPLLSDGGHVVISLPNVAAWTVRLQLLTGRWRYADRGILDRTHLRFFDRESAMQLARDCGLELMWAGSNPLLARAGSELVRDLVMQNASSGGGGGALQDSPMYQAYLKYLRPVEGVVADVAPNLLGFQHVVVARKTPARRKLSLTVGMISMNEEGAVGGVIDEIRKQVPDAEVLLVDSSKDKTPDIATARGARVLRQFPPRGYGPAMTRLLYSATTDLIITMDCDGTYPANRIVELRERIENGADLVNTTRTAHRPKAMPLANFVANRVFAATAQVMHGVNTTDLHSGMRAYRTSMLRALDPFEKGAALPVELLVVPVRRGYRVEEVEIDYFERVGTTTLQRFDSTKWTFKRLVSSYERGGQWGGKND